MAKKEPQTPQARAARDALLKRADWIVTANIHAACGYVPELPPDLLTFNLERAAEPDGRALAALLKGVMPSMILKDDLAEKNPKLVKRLSKKIESWWPVTERMQGIANE